jgi:hypothetical protein
MLWLARCRSMSTCPRCKGHLTDSHRCPRSPARIAFEMTLAALLGGLVALLIFSLIDPHGQLTMDAVWLAAGALVGVAVDRLRRR